MDVYQNEQLRISFYWKKLPVNSNFRVCNVCFRKIIYDNVELDLLKDPKFLSTLVGLGFAFVSDVTYLAMEPMLLFSYGFSQVRCHENIGTNYF